MALDTTGLASSNVSNEVILDFWREAVDEATQRDEANARYRNVLKRFRAAGGNQKALVEVIKAAKRDPEEVARDMRDALHYRSLRYPDILPEDLFGGWSNEVNDAARLGQDVWDAQQTGYAAGRNGHDIDSNPYDAGSELFAEWRSWFAKGQAAREQANGGPNIQIANPSRKRRRQRRLPMDESQPEAAE